MSHPRYRGRWLPMIALSLCTVPILTGVTRAQEANDSDDTATAVAAQDVNADAKKSDILLHPTPETNVDSKLEITAGGQLVVTLVNNEQSFRIFHIFPQKNEAVLRLPEKIVVQVGPGQKVSQQVGGVVVGSGLISLTFDVIAESFENDRSVQHTALPIVGTFQVDPQNKRFETIDNTRFADVYLDPTRRKNVVFNPNNPNGKPFKSKKIKIKLAEFKSKDTITPLSFSAINEVKDPKSINDVRIDNAVVLATGLKLGALPTPGSRERGDRGVAENTGIENEDSLAPGEGASVLNPIGNREMVNFYGVALQPEYDKNDPRKLIGMKESNIDAQNLSIVEDTNRPDKPGAKMFKVESSDSADTQGVGADSNFTIRGHMSTKYNDGSFHAAWGWVVVAWQLVPIGGFFDVWLPLGWTYVNGDASWQIPLSSLAVGNRPVYVEYKVSNRFVSVEAPNAGAYAWGDNWPLTNNAGGSTTDIGYRYADLSANGDLPGIDRIYQGATSFWSKAYYNGLNPLRNEPIEITYPNSLATGQCQQGSPAYAWSCSYWSTGKIWIIPAHGDPTVAVHEAAHSVNSYFWNGQLPNGSGGQHSLTGCYNGGLAITEGFANFVAYWTQRDRGNSSPTVSYINYNINTYNADSCSDANNNEMRVAATFWDMYDTVNDGPGGSPSRFDGWNYISHTGALSIYLGNKKTGNVKMADYLSVVDAGDPAWFEADRALFRLNKIIP